MCLCRSSIGGRGLLITDRGDVGYNRIIVGQIGRQFFTCCHESSTSTICLGVIFGKAESAEDGRSSTQPQERLYRVSMMDIQQD